MCEWYALCANLAVGTTPHPILGPVPICDRCAQRHNLPVTLTPEGQERAHVERSAGDLA